jgi:hypothetical protein
VAEAHPTSSEENANGITQSAMDDAPTPEPSIGGVTYNASVASPRAAGSSVPPPSGSDPVATASGRLTVGNSTTLQPIAPNSISSIGDEPLDALDAAALRPPSPSTDFLPLTDNEMMDIPPLPMSPPTRPDMTAGKDGQSDTINSNSQRLDNPLSPRGSTQTKTRRQPTPSQDGTSEADKQLGTSSPQVKSSRATAITMDGEPIDRPKETTDGLKTHTSGLSAPDIDSLLELIQDDDGFEEESKPQRGKVIEAVVAVRNASQSEEWSNLLRGVIILTICLGFPNGNVSETHTCLWLALTNIDRKREVNLQQVTAPTNARFGCSMVGGTTTSHRASRISFKSLALKCGSG